MRPAGLEGYEYHLLPIAMALTVGTRGGDRDRARECIGADGIWKVVADCTYHGTETRGVPRRRSAETELRMEAGVPVAGWVIRARKNGANDKSLAP